MGLYSGLCGIQTWLAICKDTESSTTNVMPGLRLEDFYPPSHVSRVSRADGIVNRECKSYQRLWGQLARALTLAASMTIPLQ